MNLRQAYTQWAAMPKNTALAAKNRNAVDAVLLKKYGDNDVREFTSFFVGKLMKECKELQPLKTKAASILTHVLTYCSVKGECVRPDFDYNIASPETPTTEKAAQGSENAPGRESDDYSPEPPSERNESGQFTKGMKPWNSGHVGYFGGGRPAISVSQIHPETLEVVAHFESVASAGRETGIKNIKRAVDDHKMSGGYYWCRQGEEECFKPGYKFGPQTRKWSRKKSFKKQDTKKALPKPTLSETQRSKALRGQSNDKLTPEREDVTLSKKGMVHGQRVHLSSFSDEELKEELRSRGWRGSLYQRMDF